MERIGIGQVMDSGSSILLNLIRGSMFGVPVSLSAAPDWDKIILKANEQTVTGLLADSMKFIPDEMKPSSGQMKRLQVFMFRNMTAHSLLNSKLAEVLELLRSEGMSPVLLKGQGLAELYGDSYVRQCGDIDLYVGPDDYRRACQLTEVFAGSPPCECENMKHTTYRCGGVLVEIHRIADNLAGGKRDKVYQQWTISHLRSENLRNIDIAGTSVSVPPVNFDVIYIMNHAWHHFVNGGIGLRQICDWTLYMHRFHDQIDVDALRKDLEDFGLSRVWEFFCGMAVRHLGLPEDECPLYTGSYSRESDRMMELIMSEGNFGRHSDQIKTPRPKGYVSGKLHSFRNITSRYSRIFMIYPSMMLKEWMHYFIRGIVYGIKGLGK